MSGNKQANEMCETIADIVAALRKCGDEWVGDMSMVYMEGAGCFASYLADCLEAAWKREKAEWEAAACAFVSDAVMSGKVAVEHAPVGNAAAMREALVKIKALLGECYNGELYEKADEAIAVADDALSAPARNCDRPECATSKDAQNVWRKEDGGKTPYYEWLLAPAEKGGAE